MVRTTLRNGRGRDGRLVDLVLEDGRIRTIRPAASGRLAVTETDLGGRLVLPLFVNGHAHFDKTFVGAPWQPHLPGGSLVERIESEKRQRAGLEATSFDRQLLLAQRMIEFGTGAVRAHVDVDEDLGLTGVEDALRLRAILTGLLDVQIAAFPQSGIVRGGPAVAKLLDEALAQGVDVIGGLDPLSLDEDLDGHLDVVFGLADRHAVRVDVHLHTTGAPAAAELRAIAERTTALGLAGRVAISHGYGLGTLEGRDRDAVPELLAEAGVAVMTNGPAGPMPAVRALVDLGVELFAGTDNVRDAWWPFGTGDPLATARDVAYQSNFRVDEDLELALELVGGRAATALGLGERELYEGGPADLVVLDAASAAEALASPPAGRDVMRAGSWLSTRRVETWSRLPDAPDLGDLAQAGA
ncbi:amidohydrolase [Nocardioides ginsengisoli]|uniref:Amidohydrolase n=1 Tax=Nocardioides ginsengisoli TaxID=363868 RepID=A0ABW3VZH3_9ACTN